MGRVLLCVIGDLSSTPRTGVKPDLLACVCSPSAPVERWEETGQFPDICRPSGLAVHNVRQPESCLKRWLRIVPWSPCTLFYMLALSPTYTQTPNSSHTAKRERNGKQCKEKWWIPTVIMDTQHNTTTLFFKGEGCRSLSYFIYYNFLQISYCALFK